MNNYIITTNSISIELSDDHDFFLKNGFSTILFQNVFKSIFLYKTKIPLKSFEKIFLWGVNYTFNVILY